MNVKQIAQVVSSKYMHIHRGAMPWEGKVCLFGNDGNVDSEPSTLRAELRRQGIRELGFATYDDYTWVIMVDSQDVRGLNDLVWEVAEQVWQEGGTLNECQKSLSEKNIA